MTVLSALELHGSFGRRNGYGLQTDLMYCCECRDTLRMYLGRYGTAFQGMWSQYTLGWIGSIVAFVELGL